MVYGRHAAQRNQGIKIDYMFDNLWVAGKTIDRSSGEHVDASIRVVSQKKVETMTTNKAGCSYYEAVISH